MNLFDLFLLLGDARYVADPTAFHHRFCDTIDENDTNFRYVILKLTKEYGTLKIMQWTAEAMETILSTGARNSLGGMLLKIVKADITKVKWDTMFKKAKIVYFK